MGSLMSHNNKALQGSYSVVPFLKNGKNKSLFIKKSVSNPIITSALNDVIINKEHVHAR
jgi:hypothetical protein